MAVVMAVAMAVGPVAVADGGRSRGAREQGTREREQNRCQNGTASGSGNFHRAPRGGNVESRIRSILDSDPAFSRSDVG